MNRQIIIGLMTEGRTDERFLTSIIKRTFDETAFKCNGAVEVLDVKIAKVEKTGFIDQVLNAARKGADQYGIMVLCVHTDADDTTDESVFKNKIFPALEVLKKTEEQNICKILAALVPIQMTEAWMLADKELLKKQIGTPKTDTELGIHRPPETVTDPKQRIEDAIRIARQGLTKKRRHKLGIADLYSVVGESINLEKLRTLSSYRKFEDAVEKAYRELNYLH